MLILFTKRKVQCNGLTAKGDPCTRTGTVQPDGSKNCYCFRHADTWKDFETTVSSDSDSDDELVEEKIEMPVKGSSNAIKSDSDDKLKEEIDQCRPTDSESEPEVEE